MEPYYYIFAPNWAPGSKGLDVIHDLCARLNEAGEDAYLHPCIQNPLLNTKLITKDIRESKRPCITVYPETGFAKVFGDVNVRWLLYYAVPAFYDKDDMFFVWDESFGEGERLNIDVYDEEIFQNTHQERKWHCWYRKKYTGDVPDDVLTGIPVRAVPLGDKCALAKVYNSSTKLWCREGSAVTLEAALCGCPSVENLDDDMDAAYLLMQNRVQQYYTNKATIPDQIRNFIEKTKAAL